MWTDLTDMYRTQPDANLSAKVSGKLARYTNNDEGDLTISGKLGRAETAACPLPERKSGKQRTEPQIDKQVCHEIISH